MRLKTPSVQPMVRFNGMVLQGFTPQAEPARAVERSITFYQHEVPIGKPLKTADGITQEQHVLGADMLVADCGDHYEQIVTNADLLPKDAPFKQPVAGLSALMMGTFFPIAQDMQQPAEPNKPSASTGLPSPKPLPPTGVSIRLTPEYQNLIDKELKRSLLPAIQSELIRSTLKQWLGLFLEWKEAMVFPDSPLTALNNEPAHVVIRQKTSA
ncbi:MAG: hypothetical protein SFZ03_01955 [Candidatus Melainabacteria bacterium]|nr:hypothetical protein [Candidatus Melainabacteria bacterium]